MRSPCSASFLSPWRSICLTIIVAVSATAAVATNASAQPTAASSAEVLNEEGKQLLYDNKPNEAAAKFRLAIAISPEGRFYYNLCVAQFQEGKFGEAIASCDSVAPNGADAALNEKVAKFKAKIADEMARQGLTPAPVTPVGPPPVNPSDPTGPTAPTQPVAPAPIVGAPPPPPSAQQPDLTKQYLWSFGGMLFSANGTGFGASDNDYDAGVGLQINSDFTLHKPLSIGVQAHLSYISLPASTPGMDALAIVDFGVTGYKNFCAGAICVTPRVGILLADLAPGNAYGSPYAGDTFQTFGFNAEISAGLAVGPQKRGLVYATGGVRSYAGSDTEGADWAYLDEAMTLSYFGIGYSYRFAKSWRDTPSMFQMRLE